MNASELKFRKGQWVKLIQNDKQKMLVVKNEEVLRSAIPKLSAPILYTGKVTCNWVDKNGQQREESFHQDALEVA